MGRIQITARHMVGGERHEHIESLQWRNMETQATGDSLRQQIVDWLLARGNDAWVTDGRNWIEVRVVNADPPYVQTYADGIWTDNLLALPRY
jgi:hypothetical protein